MAARNVTGSARIRAVRHKPSSKKNIGKTGRSFVLNVFRSGSTHLPSESCGDDCNDCGALVRELMVTIAVLVSVRETAAVRLMRTFNVDFLKSYKITNTISHGFSSLASGKAIEAAKDSCLCLGIDRKELNEILHAVVNEFEEMTHSTQDHAP